MENVKDDGVEPDAGFSEVHRLAPHLAACSLIQPNWTPCDLDRGEIGVGDRQLGIDPDGLPEQRDDGSQVLLGRPIVVRQSLEEAIPGGDVRRDDRARRGGFCPEISGPGGGQLGRDLVLHREQIADVPVVSTGP